MAKFCPITNDMVLYLDCLECETKECKRNIRTKKDDKSINEDKEDKEE